MCWHKYSKWKEVSSGFLQVEYDAFTGRKLDDKEKFINGVYVRQQRECEKCGKIQLRKERA